MPLAQVNGWCSAYLEPEWDFLGIPGLTRWSKTRQNTRCEANYICVADKKATWTWIHHNLNKKLPDTAKCYLAQITALTWHNAYVYFFFKFNTLLTLFACSHFWKCRQFWKLALFEALQFVPGNMYKVLNEKFNSTVLKW